MPPITYGPGKKQIRRLLRASSSWRAWMLLLVMGACVGGALALRLYILEPVLVDDGSMKPEIGPQKRVWICHLAWCLDQAPFAAPVLARTRTEDRVLRWKLGEPGDVLHFGALGRVQVKNHFWNWRREGTIVDEQTLRVPKAGDTLHLDSLGPMAFDFAARLYRKQWPKSRIWILPTLWNGDQPLPMATVGKASIANRPAAQNEIAGLPWQELRLIELQLQRYEASESNVHFRRRLYADSAEVHSFMVEEDCWFLACGRGAICVDSREEGFFRRSDLLGAPLPIASLTPVSPIAKALQNAP